MQRGEWSTILAALDSKTSEILSRNNYSADPYSEAERWSYHLRRIIDEIASFVRGE
jgi:hypothetical protein